MEHKTTYGGTKTIDGDQGIVEHIIAVFGNIDEGNDRLWPGSFAKTIAERGLKAKVLDQHQTDSTNRILGKPLAIREIGRNELPPELLQRFPEATGGVQATTKFLLNTPEGKGAFERIKEGALDEWSFGYDALDKDYSEETKEGHPVNVRNLRTIKLYEYSPVLWGMNPATATLGAKSAEAEPPIPDEKEWTPNGPVKRLGDFLQGSIHRLFTVMCDDWYTQGYMTREERILLSSAIGDALDALTKKMPEEMANRPLDGNKMPTYVMELTPTLELKAGRRMRGEMAEMLRQMEAMMGKLRSWADYEDNDQPAPEKVADNPQQEEKQAGPVIEPPTSDELLQLIAIEKAKLSLLEV